MSERDGPGRPPEAQVVDGAGKTPLRPGPGPLDTIDKPGAPTAPDSASTPQTAMVAGSTRFMVGGTLTAFGLFTFLPFLFGAAGIASLVLFIVAGELLQANEGLGPDVFPTAWWIAVVLVVLGVVDRFVGTFAKRAAKAKGVRPPLSSHFQAAAGWIAGVVLVVANVILAGMGPDAGRVFARTLSASVWIATWLVLSVWLPIEILVLGVRMLRATYRFSVRGRFRAGFATAGAVVLGAGFWMSQDLKTDTGAIDGQLELVASTLKQEVGGHSLQDGLRRSFDKVSKKTESEYDRKLPANALNRPALASDLRDEQIFAECYRILMAEERNDPRGDRRRPWDKAQARLVRERRMSREQAEDIVADSAFNTCFRCSIAPCGNYAAVLMTASDNLANTWIRHQARIIGCEVPEGRTVPGGCWVGGELWSGTDVTEFLDAAVCTLSSLQRSIIHLHRREVLSHAEVAAKLGLTEAKAKDEYNNAIRKMRKFLNDRRCN